MDIETLRKKLVVIPYAIMGEKASRSERFTQDRISQFGLYLEKYEFLKHQKLYVEFIRDYEGLKISYPENFLPGGELVVFGTGIFAEGEELLDASGFFCFSTCFIQYKTSLDFVETAYFFNSLDPLDLAVYGRQTNAAARGTEKMVRAYDSFSAWLEDVIACKGLLLLPEGVQ